VLEAYQLPAMVVNAQHMRAVPGRKTDVKDAEWIADLCQHGLLRASYIPDKGQRELRELILYRKSLIEDHTREVNRLQKMLEGANIKLSSIINNINGTTGRNLIEKILSGEKIDGDVYDAMYATHAIAHNLKATKEELIAGLEGIVTDLQRRMMRELTLHLNELEAHIRHLDDEIDQFMTPDETAAASAIEEIPGIGHDSAQAIISVIGTDMSRFPSANHLSKWAGLCPGNNESAQKQKSGRTTKGNKVLRTTLVTCAHSAVKVKQSFFSAQFHRISARRGSKRAYVAVAHSILIAIYNVLSKGEVFRDLGSDYYDQFNKEHKANSMVRRLKELGYEVTIATAALSV
jgi:transposase